MGLKTCKRLWKEVAFQGWKIWGWTLRISRRLIYMWMRVWEGLIALTAAQLGEMAWHFCGCMSPHQAPSEIPSAASLSPGSTGSGRASGERTQVRSELQRISLLLPCLCPQPSWGRDHLWPGESQDRKKRRKHCKRRRILSVLLFLTGKKTHFCPRDRKLKFSQTAGLKVA